MNLIETNSEYPTPPFIRIVVPAYRAMTTLRKCVSAIQCSQLDKPYELVVVDDGCNPDIQALASELNFQVIISHHRNTSIARNLGSSLFAGYIIVFIDADVQVNSSTIKLLVEPLEYDQTDATFGNYSMDDAGLNFYQKYKQIYISRIYSRKSSYVTDFFWTAIGAIKTETFMTLGGFDPELPAHIGEDIELGRRMTKMNMRIMGVPVATGKHLKHYSLRSLLSNDFKKGKSTMYLSLANNMPLTHNPHATPIDTLAVAYAAVIGTGAMLTVVSGLMLETKLIFISLLFVPYLILRREFVWLQARQGLLFMVRSIPLMYILDIVRLASVVMGVVLYCWTQAFTDTSKNQSRSSS